MRAAPYPRARRRARRRVHGRALAVGLVVGVLLVGGSAAAWFSARGAGSAAAASGSTAVLTLTPGTPTAALYPGGRSAVVLQASNPGSTAVRISQLALAVDEGSRGLEVDANHPDCGLTTLSLPAQDNGGAGWTVPASGSTTITLPGALAMTAAGDDACQGASFLVHLRVTA